MKHWPRHKAITELNKVLLPLLLFAHTVRGFPGGSDGKEPTYQCRSRSSIPWVGKIPWRRKWQPTPVRLPRKSHGQRTQTGYCPWDCKESWTVAYQAPLSTGFSRQEYCSGLPLPSPRDLPNPGNGTAAPALVGRFFTTEPPGKPLNKIKFFI